MVLPIAIRHAISVSSASPGRRTSEIRDGAQGRQVLDRLVRRAVLADEHRVVREDVDHRQLRDGRHADGGPHVVAEDHERGAERPQAAVIGDAVADGRHAVLADAEMEVPAPAAWPSRNPPCP